MSVHRIVEIVPKSAQTSREASSVLAGLAMRWMLITRPAMVKLDLN